MQSCQDRVIMGSTAEHLFLHFHIVIWTNKLLWKYPSCLSKLLLHELWPKQLRERFIIVAKLYIFLLKKLDNYLRRSYISIHLVIQCYTMCIFDAQCPQIFNGSSTSETTILLLNTSLPIMRSVNKSWLCVTAY